MDVASKSGSKQLLNIFGFDFADYDIDLLFNKNNIHNNNYSLQRVRCIMKLYDLWIKSNETRKMNENIYDIINTKLADNYRFIHFLNDFRFIMNNKHILGFHNDADGDDDDAKDAHICDINSCFIIDRFERNQEQFERNKLYFIADDKLESNDRFVAAQQCLDTAHCYIFHTILIDYNKLILMEEYEKLIAAKKGICYDRIAVKLTNIISKKMKNSKRFRESKRKKSMNKFITTNNYKSSSSNKLYAKSHKKNGSKNNECFIDGLINDLRRYKVAAISIDLFADILYGEEYDTEAFEADFNFENEASNIRNYIYSPLIFKSDESVLIEKICRKRAYLLSNIRSEYSPGIRFWYWPFYKTCYDSVNIICPLKDGSNFTESNDGYAVNDWYIAGKYSSLKAELLEPEIAAFGISEWNTTKQKATIKYEAWMEDPPHPLICEWQIEDKSAIPGNKWDKLYGIKQGSIISIGHIMGLLFYTNYTKQSYELSATFRRKYYNEPDVEWKKRHSNFANWSRILRETVECFGTTMSRSPVNIYYHGIAQTMLFQSTSFKIYGPLSTTAEFEVAAGRFAKRDGMVVDIRNDGHGQLLFNCQFWSDFTDENERFFIGSIQHFDFKTIHDMKEQKDYAAFIEPIDIMMVMFAGYPYEHRGVKSLDVSCLDSLFKFVITDNDNDNIPLYIQDFIKNVCNKLKYIEINMEEMNCHKEYAEKSNYGYKLLKVLFFKNGYVDLSKLFKIFQNKLKSIIIYNIKRAKQGFLPSISICNETFVDCLLNGISVISSSPILSGTFNEILIVNPKDDINKFIHSYSHLFNSQKWHLNKIKYNHIERAGICNNTLSIKAM